MNRLLLPGLIFLAVAVAFARGEEPRKRAFQDDLLDKLVGDWKLVRKMPGRTEENKVHVQWALNHQFLQIHMTDVKQPAAYEAQVLIGYDPTQKHYVAHWIDTFGGEFSRVGYGSRSGNSILFVFEYPDGPFHNKFTWDPEAKTWCFLMTQKDKQGKWTTFGEDKLTRQ